MEAATRTELEALNEWFIYACRKGSWDDLREILSDSFRYLDGNTGEPWPMERYVRDLDGHPEPTLTIDQVEIHVDGAVATVSARTTTGGGSHNRYLDTYERRDQRWLCVHACVWRLAD